MLALVLLYNMRPPMHPLLLSDRGRTFIMRKVSAMEPPGMSSVTRMYGSCFVHAPRNCTALGWCTYGCMSLSWLPA